MLQLADELSAAGAQAGTDGVDMLDGERDVAEDGVGVDAGDGGEILRRWKALSRLPLTP